MRQRGFIVSPLLLYAIAGVVIVGALTGMYFSITSSARAEGYAKAKAECEEAARIQREAEIGKANLAATEKEKGDAKAKVIYRTITREVDKIVDRPVYRADCFDADGMSSVNAALARPGSTAAKPDGGMPRPLPAVGREGRDGAAKTD